MILSPSPYVTFSPFVDCLIFSTTLLAFTLRIGVSFGIEIFSFSPQALHVLVFVPFARTVAAFVIEYFPKLCFPVAGIVSSLIIPHA